jgi:hypothetical protein
MRSNNYMDFEAILHLEKEVDKIQSAHFAGFGVLWVVHAGSSTF